MKIKFERDEVEEILIKHLAWLVDDKHKEISSTTSYGDFEFNIIEIKTEPEQEKESND